MGTILRQRGPSNLFKNRVAAALLMVALAGLVAAPAAALPPRGIVPAPQVPDPCGQTSPSILTFAATPSTVTLGQLIDLSWRVAA